jgi:transcription elongation factor
MRKLMATGLTALSALTFTLGSAGAAKADIVPPVSIVTQVCNSLPGPIASLVNQISAGTNALTSANTDFATKSGELTPAVTNLVTAIVNHVNTVNNGGNVTASGQQLSAAASVYGDKMSAWSLAYDKLFAAQKNVLILNTVTSPVLNGIDTGLLCP